MQQRKAASEDDALGAYVDQFLKQKGQDVTAGDAIDAIKKRSK